MTYNSEKLIPFDLNQFPLDRSWKDVVVKFDVSVTSQSLSLKQIKDGYEYRHEIIMRLHDEGFSDREISEHLNDQNILTPTGLEYYPKLVWVTRKKFRDREDRKSEYDIQIGPMSFYLRRKTMYKVK